MTVLIYLLCLVACATIAIQLLLITLMLKALASEDYQHDHHDTE